MPSPLFRNSNNRRQNEQQAAQQARSGQPSQYGMRSLKSAITSAVTKKLGDVGQLLSALFRPFGAKSVSEEVAAAVEAEMRKMGQQVQEPQPLPVRPPVPGIGGRQPAEIDDWRYEQNDPPILEGPFLVKSSNVYSIAFEFVNGTSLGNLIVTFLGGDSKNRHGAGASYRYKGITHFQFEDFLTAASAGGWVWDHLRLRGSVVGHQVDFEIVSKGNLASVPRASQIKRGQVGSFFSPRTLNGERSALPERHIGKARGQIQGWNRPKTSRPVFDHRHNNVSFIDSTGRRRG